MSEGKHFADALEQLFTSNAPGQFTPFIAVLDGLNASQAASVLTERFNSIWAVVNHIRYLHQAELRRLQNLPVDNAALGTADGSGWPPIEQPIDETAWQAARTRARAANRALAQYIAQLSEAALDEQISDSKPLNTRRTLIQSMLVHNSYHIREILVIQGIQAGSHLCLGRNFPQT